MNLTLPRPPQSYDQTDQAQTRDVLQQAAIKNVQTDTVLDKLMFRDTSTGIIKTVVVTAGILVVS